jgi:hypothetical protein
MKKFLLAVSLSLAVVLTTAAHPVTSENPRVEKAFQKMFAGASHVNWSEVNDGLLKVSFIWGDHQTLAIFDKNAQLIGTLRGLFFKELPLSVTKSVREHFSSPIVLEANEIFTEAGIRYALVVENDNQKYKIDVDSLGSILAKEKYKK